MSTRLFVKNIPWSATDQELASFFGQCGTVTNVTLITDRETGRSKGFGFVELEEGGEEALQLNGSEFGGRKLIIEKARPKEQRNDRGGSYRGGDHREYRGDHRGRSQRQDRY